MKYWIYTNGMYYEKPEQVMFCGGCGIEVPFNPALYCPKCLQNAAFSWKERRRLAKLANEKVDRRLWGKI